MVEQRGALFAGGRHQVDQQAGIVKLPVEIEDAAAQSGEGVARVDPVTKVKVGERITFAVNTAGMQFFDPETDEAIWT